jgi:hypothetical protein
VVASFANGLAFLDLNRDYSSCIMAMGFIVAAVSYTTAIAVRRPLAAIGPAIEKGEGHVPESEPRQSLQDHRDHLRRPIAPEANASTAGRARRLRRPPDGMAIGAHAAPPIGQPTFSVDLARAAW